MTVATVRHAPTSRITLLTAVVMSVIMVLRPHELVPGLAVVRPVILMMIVGGWVFLTQTPWQSVLQDTVFKRYAALLGWAMLTLPFALYRAAGIQTLQKLIVIVLLVALLVAMPVSKGTTRTFLKWYLLAFVGYGMLVLAKGVQSAGEGRLSGISSYDPNELAALCSFSLALALGHLRSQGLLNKVIALAAVGVALIIVLRTGSRGGAIGLGVVLLLTLMSLPRRWILPGLMLAGLVVVGGWAVAPPTFKARIQTIGSLNDDYNASDYTGRKAIWTRGLGYMAAHPVTGVGLSNYEEAEGQFLAANGRRGKWSAAHNSFVQIGAELGIPGLLLLLSLLLAAFTRARTAWGQRDGTPAYPEAVVALASFVVTSVFLSLAYSEMLAFVAGIAVLVDRERRASLWSPARRPVPIASPGGAMRATTGRATIGRAAWYRGGSASGGFRRG